MYKSLCYIVEEDDFAHIFLESRFIMLESRFFCFFWQKLKLNIVEIEVERIEETKTEVIILMQRILDIIFMIQQGIFSFLSDF